MDAKNLARSKHEHSKKGNLKHKRPHKAANQPQPQRQPNPQTSSQQHQQQQNQQQAQPKKEGEKEELNISDGNTQKTTSVAKVAGVTNKESSELYKYSRRKLTSNAYRYEGGVEPTSADDKGSANLRELLAEGGNTEADQVFKLRIEKDWDAALASASATEVAFDLEAFASLLLSLPLSNRLSIADPELTPYLSSMYSVVKPNDEDVVEEGYEQEEQEECWGVTQLALVGIRHYSGKITPSEQVLLVRDPQNPHDRNAIAVQNIQQQKIGYIEAPMALVLTPLLDENLVRLEGYLPNTAISGVYKINLLILAFGKQKNRAEFDKQTAMVLTLDSKAKKKEEEKEETPPSKAVECFKVQAQEEQKPFLVTKHQLIAPSQDRSQKMKDEQDALLDELLDL